MGLRGVVFGWYHQRNAGDDRFVHCIERWLHDHELTFLPHTQPPPLDVLRRADYAILGCGSIANQVHGVFSGMRRWIAAAGLPVFGVGLTVSQYPELRDELRAVIDSGGGLWLRDQPSADWLGFEESVVGPDITWLFPRPLERAPAPGTVAVNFRPWEKREWNPADWGRALRRLGMDLVPWPLCFGRDDDRPAIAGVTGSAVATAEFDPTVPARAELVVAMRFHACIFALQAGAPVVPVGNSKKLDWLLRQLELESLAVPVESPADLPRAVEAARGVCTPTAVRELTARQFERARGVADQFRERIERAARAARPRRRGLLRRLRFGL